MVIFPHSPLQTRGRLQLGVFPELAVVRLLRNPLISAEYLQILITPSLGRLNIPPFPLLILLHYHMSWSPGWSFAFRTTLRLWLLGFLGKQRLTVSNYHPGSLGQRPNGPSRPLSALFSIIP